MGAVAAADSPSRWLLQRDPARAPVVFVAAGLDEDPTFGRIRCPHCAWRPTPSSRWACNGPDGAAPGFRGCGAVWNTFTTRGLCPGCNHRWQWTACLRCSDWALHEEWYEPQAAD
jgi:hypothetical protein